MEKSEFVLFFTLLLSCLVAAQCKSPPMYPRFPNKNRYENSLYDPSELLIDESRLMDSSQTGQKETDRIQRLPGQPKVTFKQYGGYVNINQKTGKAFYYYFVEAQKFPGKSPLLLWLNGGPGCSSLAYGAMQELGPFRVQSDGKSLQPNNYSWNQVANVLFLESPVGVGFSYSNMTTADMLSGGDNQTASDNYVFLINWLERFPEYKTRDFYICGESYAGHYVPQLAQTILHQNKMDKTNTRINMKGILIGNPTLNDETDDKGMFEYWASHALISDDLTNQIMKYCGFARKGHGDKKACHKVVDESYKVYDQIDIYNIYWPLCHDSNLTDKPKKYSIFEFDPCSDDYVNAYLNRPDVQKALHANVTKIPYKWEACNSSIIRNWNWKDSPDSVLPTLKELMKNELRVWIYSGDVDGRVPVTGTQLSIREMKLQIKDPWHPWNDTNGEVGGYTQVYVGDLTFATVRGAGHEVPSYQPARALLLVTYFLEGAKLPALPG